MPDNPNRIEISKCYTTHGIESISIMLQFCTSALLGEWSYSVNSPDVIQE